MQRSNCTQALELSCHKRQVICLLGRGCVEGMRVQVSSCLWGLWRKAQDTSWSCLIKALTGPDYMSEPGGGVCVSFLHWRKSIWWERGGALPVGVSICKDANTYTLSSRHHYHCPSTPNKHPHPSHLPDHTQASRRHNALSTIHARYTVNLSTVPFTSVYFYSLLLLSLGHTFAALICHYILHICSM